MARKTKRQLKEDLYDLVRKYDSLKMHYHGVDRLLDDILTIHPELKSTMHDGKVQFDGWAYRPYPIAYKFKTGNIAMVAEDIRKRDEKKRMKDLIKSAREGIKAEENG